MNVCTIKSRLIYKNGTTSLDIKNNLYLNNDKIINMQDFNSEKLSVIKNNNNNKIHVYYDHNPFFFSLFVV